MAILPFMGMIQRVDPLLASHWKRRGANQLDILLSSPGLLVGGGCLLLLKRELPPRGCCANLRRGAMGLPHLFRLFLPQGSLLVEGRVASCGVRPHTQGKP